MCVTVRPVLTYIINHPDSWKEDLQAKNIKIKNQNDLVIFNYSPGADFSDEIVRDARGLIIDIKNLRIVCYPFTKFGNYFESYADSIDWSTAKIQEKIDGSIVKLYWYQDQWHWATNSCIDAANATVQGNYYSFLDVIYQAINYDNIEFEKLDKTKTYIFELVSPATQIVVKYSYTKLYHLGTRSNLTGVEYNEYIGIEHPRTYHLDSLNLEEVLKLVELINNNQEVEHEGFVVVDGDYNRIKIKNSQYLQLHHNIFQVVLTKQKAIEIIRTKDEEAIFAIESIPRLNVQLKFYQWQYAKFYYDTILYMDAAKDIYYSFNQNRKMFAQTLEDDPKKSFAFLMINHLDQTPEEIIKNLPDSRILKYIQNA